jgi:hypothetical protein
VAPEGGIVHSYDALNTYVTDRQQAREQAATTARTGRLLRRARTALGASGPAGSADTAAPVPTPSVSFPVVAEAATGAATGTTRDPAVAVLRTAATAGDPRAA